MTIGKSDDEMFKNYSEKKFSMALKKNSYRKIVNVWKRIFKMIEASSEVGKPAKKHEIVKHLRSTISYRKILHILKN